MVDPYQLFIVSQYSWRPLVAPLKYLGSGVVVPNRALDHLNSVNSEIVQAVPSGSWQKGLTILPYWALTWRVCIPLASNIFPNLILPYSHSASTHAMCCPYFSSHFWEYVVTHGTHEFVWKEIHITNYCREGIYLREGNINRGIEKYLHVLCIM